MNTSPRIYVACLASYNNGVLHGAWIDATTDTDVMQAEIAAILRTSKFPNVTVVCEACEGSGKKTFHNSENGDTRQGDCPTCLGAGGVPSAEEWAIHDSEGLGNIGEYAGLQAVADLVAIIEVAEERDIPSGVLIEAMSDMGATDAEEFMSDQFDGQADSWEAFCEEQFTETGGLEGVPESLQCYIDFERMGRDWSLSGDWSAYRDGDFGTLYFFRSN